MPPDLEPSRPKSPNLPRLRHFVQEFSRLLNRPDLAHQDDRLAETHILKEGQALLADLVAHDDWLPDDYAQPHPERYQQYLLYADWQEKFSVVSFVWGPGQTTPIHDHTVWGLIGLLRGEETSQAFAKNEQGQWVKQGALERLHPGQVSAVSPRIGDVHQVANGLTDAPSISIHVYGANIGAVRRSVFTPDGQQKSFISGYSNLHMPNLWDRSH
jgi:predicted metal-dependent enzyme (double-stranded beta helix superfamily)